MRRRGCLALGVAAGLAAGTVPLFAQAPKVTREDVARLLQIAVMTEWVSGQCGERYVAELNPMLLLTTGSLLRTADAGDVERVRAAVLRKCPDLQDEGRSLPQRHGLSEIGAVITRPTFGARSK